MQHYIDSAVKTATINGVGIQQRAVTGLSTEQIIKHHSESLHGHYNVVHFSIVRNAEEDLFRPTHYSYR